MKIAYKVINGGTRTSAVMGSKGKVYPISEWVERDSRLGPLMAFRSMATAKGFAVGSQMVVRCEFEQTLDEPITLLGGPEEVDLEVLEEFWSGSQPWKCFDPDDSKWWYWDIMWSTVFCRTIRCIE